MNKPGERLRSFQLEHEEAANAGRRWKARLVRAIAGVAFIRVFVICVSRAAVSWRDTSATDDQKVLARVLAWSGAMMMAVAFSILSVSAMRRWMPVTAACAAFFQLLHVLDGCEIPGLRSHEPLLRSSLSRFRTS